MEIWKAVPVNNNYQISDQGRIRNVKRDKIVATVFVKGYEKVTLHSKGKRTTYRVHRLVAMAFLSDYVDGIDVDHIDRVRSNNNVTNLRMSVGNINALNKIKSVGAIEHVIELYNLGYSVEAIRDSLKTYK